MNKDVVYIEPEDDITDIIAKLGRSEQKVVALVPPKKIGVLRSAVNTKLIAKAAAAKDKVAVIVTADPSLVKLAAAAGLPVAKTLQSRPKMPSEFAPEELASSVVAPEIIDERDYTDPEGGAEAELEDTSDMAAANKSVRKGKNRTEGTNKNKKADKELNSADLEGELSGKKGKKSKKAGKIPSLDKYRKLIIFGIIAGIALVIFLVWALVFAPSAKIAVAVRTTANNFSENVTFTTSATAADPENGKFYLEARTSKKDNSVEFKATGSKDIGEKATGTLTATATLKSPTTSVDVPAGTTFSYGNLSYTSNSNVSLVLDKGCDAVDYAAAGCTVTGQIAVTATDSGTDYNIGTHESGWSSPISEVSVVNASAFTGGTSEVVTIVQQSDIDTARSQLENAAEADGRSALASQFGNDILVIETSYSQQTSTPVATPGVGEEVKSGVTPKITSTTTYTMYGVDKNKLKEFIEKKTTEKLAEDQKIYATGEPFIERFSEDNGNYTGRVKSTTQTGPKVTEQDILEKSMGRKVGEIQTLLKSINGVSSVKVDTSFFWVGSIPDDPNKVTVDLKVEE